MTVQGDQAGKTTPSLFSAPSAIPRSSVDPVFRKDKVKVSTHQSINGVVSFGGKHLDLAAPLKLPSQHRAKIHATHPLERLNGEIKRRADIVCIFPNEGTVVRLLGALLLAQNDEWTT